MKIIMYIVCSTLTFSLLVSCVSRSQDTNNTTGEVSSSNSQTNFQDNIQKSEDSHTGDTNIKKSNSTVSENKNEVISPPVFPPQQESSSQQLPNSLTASTQNRDPVTSLPASQNISVDYLDADILYNTTGISIKYIHDPGKGAITDAATVETFYNKLSISKLKLVPPPVENPLKFSYFVPNDDAIAVLEQSFQYCWYVNPEVACLEIFDSSNEIKESIWMESNVDLYNMIINEYINGSLFPDITEDSVKDGKTVPMTD